ncbi:hypothetical protein NDU88_001356 [Pleurodeles waltl]|uniref:Uncharacterized protein n=1 Tax=Pleurodeles waltl TaxID=8319 RepID=A0AAV7SZ75_PLEWA|nr:hypothetical protein NDU88_001346 [Pleurodeles waltl]KAJ1169463.1 hypothetical protein NDU88_001356 [Pleurodeles waltl]
MNEARARTTRPPGQPRIRAPAQRAALRDSQCQAQIKASGTSHATDHEPGTCGSDTPSPNPLEGKDGGKQLGQASITANKRVDADGEARKFSIGRTLDAGAGWPASWICSDAGVQAADRGDALLRRFGGAASRGGLLFRQCVFRLRQPTLLPSSVGLAVLARTGRQKESQKEFCCPVSQTG